MTRLIPAPSLGLLRLVLIGLNAIAIVSLLLELVFLQHFQQPFQGIALLAAGLGVLAVLASLVQHHAARAVVAVVALGLLGAGATGALLHFLKNLEYAQEKTIWAALTGSAPAFAPLALANVGLTLLVTLWLGKKGM
jgi:hypothetical protein